MNNYTKKYFGTDGIRGTANSFPIKADIALKIGMALGAKFGKHFTKDLHRHRVVIGKDTRLSGYMIEPALTAGFVSMGLDVFLVGPVPTPAVSMLTRSLRADIGIMISASHNPFYDNGIKIFDRNGNKLDDKIEMEIENLIENNLEQFLALPHELGRVKRLEDPRGRYIEYVKNSFPRDKNLNHLKIVVDCANGASYNIAPTIFKELGAEVIEIGVEPNGFNINEKCGSTYPQTMQKIVKETQADIGIALDGDADRLVVIDENANIVSGDSLIALIAEKLHNEGKLRSDVAVITHMSNMALDEYLNYIGISTVRTKIGDRYLIEEMRKNKYNFGAEQSGHIVLGDYSSTGDGLVASLQILAILASNPDLKMSSLNKIFTPNPQILKNIKFTSNINPLDSKIIQDFIASQELKLTKAGRILVRKSGTENLIRIMIEDKDTALIENIANEIANKINEISKN